MRIVFMGTPEFAVPVLGAIVEAGHEVIGVFCQPDRPKGRGQKGMPPPVKTAALSLGLPVLQYERLRRREGVEALAALAPEVCVTAAFGQILSQKLLDIPRHGTINLHASLLPRYRGPAPVQWALINGESVTGITTMRTDIGVDTGDIILQEEVAIAPEDTAQTLLERLSSHGARLMARTLDDWPSLPLLPQDAAEATHFPMLAKEDGRLDWRQDARRVADRARGVTPWPGAWGTMAGSTYRFGGLRAADGSGAPGEVMRADAREGLAVACGLGAVIIGSIQEPGGRMMPALDWLRGHALPGKAFEVLHEG